MQYFNILRILSIPFIFLGILLSTNPKSSEVRASTKLNPANEKDLDLYRSMGITYICTTSAKGTDLDFEKSLVVAANLFSTVIQQKHGGYIKEGKKKELKVNAKVLQNNVAFQLVGGALSYCPDNVPEKMKKEFNNQYNKLKESNKK